MTRLPILIPAAGRAARMQGRDKLLEPVDGTPLLTRQARIALATGAPVLVTLPPAAAARQAVLPHHDRLEVQILTDASEGIAASLRAGARWAQRREAAGVMILLADLPELETADLRAVAARFIAAPGRVWRATDAAGRPGHPVILPARLLPALARITGDDGASALLISEDVGRIRLPGGRATTDLDTPAQWDAWRARSGR